MILISAVLVLAAIGLLIAGVALAKVYLVIGSIAASAVSAICLLVGAFLRRHELWGSSAAAGSSGAKAKRHAAIGEKKDVDPFVPVQVGPSPDVPGAAVVQIIPGRKRYHLDSCRQLAGRDSQELTYEEAHEEGFTACTACLPDSVLAARAAAATPVAPAAEADGAEADGAEADGADETEVEAVSQGVPEVLTVAEDQTVTSRSWFRRPKPPAAVPEVTEEPAEELSAADEASADEISDDESDEVADGAEPVESDEAVEPEDTEPEAAAETEVAAETADETASAEESVSAELASDEAGAPEAHVEDEQAATPSPAAGRVRVIIGTRRYHSSVCALIKGAGEGAVESMTQAEAEAAGLTQCAVCQSEREAVGQ